MTGVQTCALPILREIERILYFEAFVVIDPGMTTLERGQLLTDEQYLEAIEEQVREIADRGMRVALALPQSRELVRDPERWRQGLAEVRDRLGVTGLVVTHSRACAFSVGDRIGLIEEGRILEEGTVAEMTQSENPLVSAFLGGGPGGAD